jgi:hypothetical protein
MLLLTELHLGGAGRRSHFELLFQTTLASGDETLCKDFALVGSTEWHVCGHRWPVTLRSSAV